MHPAALLLALAAALPAQEPAEERPLPLRVNRSIARGVQHLIESQGEDGRWTGDEGRYPGGLTAFVAYALVKSGVRRNDPDLAEALRALATIETRSTYGASARLLLYESLRDPAAWREPAQRYLDHLLVTQRGGLWAYPEGEIDLSNVQFAVLGLHAAVELGLDVPERALADCAKALWRYQDGASGGFQYRFNVPQTGGITAAALGSVALLERLERLAETRREVGGVLRKYRRERASADAWLVENWDPARNAWGTNAWTPAWSFPYLWAVERYCELSGRELLGEHDWYAEGAEHLVALQEENGSWGKHEDTCFALLFLRRTTFSGGEELAEIYEDIDAEATEPKPKPPTLHAEVPWLTDWLVAGPFIGKPGATGLHDPPFAPARVKLKDGGKVGRKKWQRVALKDHDWTNVEEELARFADHSVWALGTRLTLPEEEEPVDALLWLWLEDGWRAYFDGEEVSSGTSVQAPIDGRIRVKLRLTPGAHDLVVIAEDAIGAAPFGARLSGAYGERLDAPVEAGLGRRKKR